MSAKNIINGLLEFAPVEQNRHSDMGSSSVSVDEFIQELANEGITPYTVKTEGIDLEYYAEQGKVTLFFFNTVYEFTTEEFAEIRQRLPGNWVPTDGTDGTD